jgi:protein-S-isoprenylcysteine O-methyltransferase Ste14
MSAYTILIIGWAVYFLVHSLLAADGVKNYFSRVMGKFYRYYRIIYNTISGIGLIVLLLLNASIPSAFIIEADSWTRYFSLLLATAGIFILKAAFRQYNLGGFMGLRDDEHDTFRAGGILKHIRHPLYSATILIAAGFWLFVPNVTTLVSVCCILVYLAVGIPLEERKLIRKYGEAYKEYKKRVPSLIPRLR